MLHLRKNLPFILLFIGIFSYILYFSLFSILRYEKLYSHYFDLGIMHQTVYNTYQGIRTGDFSRILEMTDPHGSAEQVKRMAVHNDVFLLFLAPFYFIHDGPATILIIQSIVLGLGALFVFLIAQKIFKKYTNAQYFALVFAYGYLLYPPLQKANNFDFHAVTLATTFLLGMYYFLLKKRYMWSLIFAGVSMLTKEQVGLTVAFFGAYTIFDSAKEHVSFSRATFKKFVFGSSLLSKIKHFFTKKQNRFGLFLFIIGVLWVIVSIKIIIPHFRMGEHFAMKYFQYLRNTPMKIIPVIFRYETFHYIFILLMPLGLLSLFAPFQLFIALPDIAMNVLSTNSNMRNIYFHYDSVITPFVFISAMYGAHTLLESKFSVLIRGTKHIAHLIKLPKGIVQIVSRLKHDPEHVVMSFLIGSIVVASLYMSPLPWGHHKDMFPWGPYPEKYADIKLWKMYLSDESIKVSTTGHLAPHFTSRRYFYNFAEGYDLAAYVVIDRSEIHQGFQTELKSAEYEKILHDWRYIKMYDVHDIEVYKKLKF
ncbi:MAG: DUF2079 domain-containing protein [Candidatus Roizmanbacteria bacterium]|nr:DUF2079 domain-containing protein [Candidatus Roizmanbacteria bacterium]